MKYKTALEADEFAKEFLEEPKTKKKAKRSAGAAQKSTTKPSKSSKSTEAKIQKSAKTTISKSSSKTKTAKTKTQKTVKGRKSSNLRDTDPETISLTELAASAKSIPKPAPKLDFDVNAVADFAQLLAAVEAKVPKITLANNIMATENLLINHNLTLDFNGFSIISEDVNQAARVLDVRSGKVKLVGKGKIFAMGLRSVAIRVFGAISAGVPDYTKLSVGADISLFAPDNYGILISPNLGVAYGLTVNFAGRIFARDGICLAYGIRGRETNLPVINIESGARITADEQSGVAIEAAGYGKWQITEARLRGAVGASLRTGVANFSQVQMLAANGPVFRVEDSTEPELEVTVDGGEYLSQSKLVIDGLAEGIKEFTIKDGDFCSEDDSMAEALLDIVEVEGGDFQNNVKETYVQMAESFAEPETTLQSNQEAEISTQAGSLEHASEDSLSEAMTTDGSQTNSQIKTVATAETTSRTDDNNSLAQVAVTETPSDEENLGLLDVSDSEDVDSWFEQAFAEGELILSEQNPADIPELTDDATDEQEILQELEAEKAVPLPPAPVAMPPLKQPIAENDAARMALVDAIMDIRKLSAEDYDVGFGTLEKALSNAEQVLANPLAELVDIRDAASNLLLAFDGLEERNEFSLSDDELDELFYHGAVLEEMARPSAAGQNMPSELSFGNAAPEVALNSANTVNAEPDFTVLSDILDTISELDLGRYSAESRLALLQSLDRAQEILRDEKSSQSMVDEIAASLLAQISKLNPALALHAPVIRAKTSAPAPVVTAITPATMIDEMAPSAVWSQGITMIDELTPFMTDATTREKMLRAMRPWVVGLAELVTEPARNLFKSIKAGTSAGLRVYRETRNYKI